MRITVAALLLALAPLLTHAQSGPYTPAPGTEERAALMDALRAPVEKDLKQAVVFKIDRLKVKGDWAFMRGVPQKPNGEPIDYSKTKFKEAINEDAFDDGFCALLKRTDDEWEVVEYSIGATDVPWVTWADDHGAPKAIFE